MQRELTAYVRLPSFPALVFTPKGSTDVAGLSVERLSESDASYLQADLLVEIGSTEDAERLLTNALTVDPSHTDAKVALDRESTFAWYELSLAAIASGHDKEADEALAEIIKRDSNPAWYRTRTYDAYMLGRDEAVIRSAGAFIRSAGPGNESSPYMGYAAALACMRLGLQADAAVRLKSVEESVAPESWQRVVAQYPQGQFSSEKLLDKAKTDGERTEAHAYIGALSAAQGRREDALVHLRWVKEHGLKNYVEYRMATADLERLEAAKPR